MNIGTAISMAEDNKSTYSLELLMRAQSVMIARSLEPMDVMQRAMTNSYRVKLQHKINDAKEARFS